MELDGQVTRYDWTCNIGPLEDQIIEDFCYYRSIKDRAWLEELWVCYLDKKSMSIKNDIGFITIESEIE